MDNTVTDQTSVLRFIEDNWLNGQRIGGRSFDSFANPIVQMFDFKHNRDDGDYSWTRPLVSGCITSKNCQMVGFRNRQI